MSPSTPASRPASFAALRRVLTLGLCLLAPLLCSGCAALAVSLAGAGAGAGFSHQINGTASRTFSAPMDKVASATQIAAKKLLLQVDEQVPLDKGQLTRARLSDMDLSLELESLSPTLTRVSVTARKNLFLLDGATAQEIVVQIERAMLSVESAPVELATREDALVPVQYSSPSSEPAPPSRKATPTSSKRKRTI
ncbi:DUF3568 family protein [Uliginosibacterium sediminicola]|uniref:DUF3568 family protein n=1 Tax=Uliginosibacterium sediminicola TaxID=2024550 RepID=A0ABU9YTY6_9RHOO